MPGDRPNTDRNADRSCQFSIDQQSGSTNQYCLQISFRSQAGVGNWKILEKYRLFTQNVYLIRTHFDQMFSCRSVGTPHLHTWNRSLILHYECWLFLSSLIIISHYGRSNEQCWIAYFRTISFSTFYDVNDISLGTTNCYRSLNPWCNVGAAIHRQRGVGCR